MDKKEDRAPYLEMSPGLNGIVYKQDFVRAPMSLHPPKQNAHKDDYMASKAMDMCLGK
jgi:hypothetical protein